MKKFFKNLAFGVGWSLVLLQGCTKDETEILEIEQTSETETQAEFETPQEIQDIDGQVLSYILEIGYIQEQIEEKSDSYIVDGDIVFPKDMVLPRNKKTGGLTDHLYTGNLVTINPGDITVFANANMNSQSNEINAAIALWNNANSRVKFRRVYSGTRRITITNVNLGNGNCGNAYGPSGGNPGTNVNINIAWVTAPAQNHDFNQRMINIAHELGHTIGFQHTIGANNGPAIPVPGFPNPDLHSIMRGGICGNLSTVLSANDIGALRALYPIPSPPPLSMTPASLNLTQANNSNTSVSITGTGPVTLTLTGDSGILLQNGSTTGTTLSFTAPKTIIVYMPNPQSNTNRLTRINLKNSSGSIVAMTTVYHSGI